jgi:hypothetical protein
MDKTRRFNSPQALKVALSEQQYTQLLRDKLQETLSSADSLSAAADRLAQEEDVFFSMRFLLQRPLLKAILSEQPTAC